MGVWVISVFASLRPWGGVRLRDRTLETVHQASELMTQQRMPPTQLTAHVTDPASPSGGGFSTTHATDPNVPDKVLGI